MKTILTEDDFRDPSEVRKAQQEQVLSNFIEKADKPATSAAEHDDFKHHKLMAGYHSVKAAELNDEALKLNSSSNADLHAIAKEKKGEAARHMKATEEHREKAKGLYKKETHGDWNQTIPTKADALKYGSKQAKKADKQAESIESEKDVLDEKKDDKVGGQEKKDKEVLMKKSEEVEKSEQFDKAETHNSGLGSKGGKIIGFTRTSSKAIYDSHAHPAHQHFNAEDHKDAAILHASLVPVDHESDKGKFHIEQSNLHNADHIRLSRQEDRSRERAETYKGKHPLYDHMNAMLSSVDGWGPHTHDDKAFKSNLHSTIQQLTGGKKGIKDATDDQVSTVKAKWHEVRGKGRINKADAFAVLGVEIKKSEQFASSEDDDTLGQTSTNKTVWREGGSNYKHASFTPEEHHEAAALHRARAERYGQIASKLDEGVGRIHVSGMQKRHMDHAASHEAEAQRKFTMKRETV